jgi:hypothetical protein
MKSTFFFLGFLLFIGLVNPTAAQTPAEKIQQLGLQVPEISQPIANYVKWKQMSFLNLR